MGRKLLKFSITKGQSFAIARAFLGCRARHKKAHQDDDSRRVEKSSQSMPIRKDSARFEQLNPEGDRRRHRSVVRQPLGHVLDDLNSSACGPTASH